MIDYTGVKVFYADDGTYGEEQFKEDDPHSPGWNLETGWYWGITPADGDIGYVQKPIGPFQSKTEALLDLLSR